MRRKTFITIPTTSTLQLVPRKAATMKTLQIGLTWVKALLNGMSISIIKIFAGDQESKFLRYLILSIYITNHNEHSGELPGQPQRPDTVEFDVFHQEYAPVQGMPQLRQAVADHYNHVC